MQNQLQRNVSKYSTKGKNSENYAVPFYGKLNKKESNSTVSSERQPFKSISSPNSQFKELSLNKIVESSTRSSSSMNSQRRKLENYQIEQVLGKGTFGTVYRCVYLPENKVLAMKEINFSEQDEPYSTEMQNYCKGEISICQKIKKSFFLPENFQTFRQNDICYIMNEMLDGCQLCSLIQMVTLSPDAIQYYLASLLLAIEQCHELVEIVHRDIKPDNIMILSNGRLKLLDFGCSKFLESGAKTNSLVGTYEYFSPEMFSGTYGKEADLWAFAVVAYELFMGKLPFPSPQNYFSDHDKLYQLSIKIKKRKKISLQLNLPRFPSFIEGILNGSFEERIQNWGIQQIKQSQFFSSINWEKLKNGLVECPMQISEKIISEAKKLEKGAFDAL